MRRLFLIRHAKAEPSIGQPDFDRRLTDRGRDDARRVAGALAQRKLVPEILVHSGAARAKETAEIFAGAWAKRVPLEEAFGLYDATLQALFARARALPDALTRVAFIGHNPGLGELANALAGLGAHAELKRMATKFPTCAVAALDFDVDAWDEIDRRAALLAMFVTPDDASAAAEASATRDPRAKGR